MAIQPPYKTPGLSTRIGFKYQNPQLNPLTIFQFARACPVHNMMQVSATFFAAIKLKDQLKSMYQVLYKAGLSILAQPKFVIKAHAIYGDKELMKK